MLACHSRVYEYACLHGQHQRRTNCSNRNLWSLFVFAGCNISCIVLLFSTQALFHEQFFHFNVLVYLRAQTHELSLSRLVCSTFRCSGRLFHCTIAEAERENESWHFPIDKISHKLWLMIKIPYFAMNESNVSLDVACSAQPEFVSMLTQRSKHRITVFPLILNGQAVSIQSSFCSFPIQ